MTLLRSFPSRNALLRPRQSVIDIAVFFGIAQTFGAIAPLLYGALIGNGSNRTGLAIGYLIGGGVMIIGGLVEVFLGIDAEGKPLEQVARPLTEVGSKGGTS